MGGLPDPWTFKYLDVKNLDAHNSGFLPMHQVPFPVALEATQPTTDALKFLANPIPHQRKFIIFDHSGNLTTLFSSMLPPIQNSDPKGRISFDPKHSLVVSSSTAIINQSSIWNEAVSDKQCVCQEEDTDMIDDLLYSDSDEDVRCSTGQFPLITALPEEDVASSGGHANEKDTTDVDTASSPLGENDLSSCVKGPAEWIDNVGRDTPLSSSGSEAKPVGRDRIHEAVCALRRVIPGCKGQTDVIAVLDEAIRYLKSIEFKSRSFGIAL